MTNVPVEMKEILDEHFGGNRKMCALSLEITQPTLCRVLSGKSKAGAKLMGNIIKYCRENDIDYTKYIKF